MSPPAPALIVLVEAPRLFDPWCQLMLLQSDLDDVCALKHKPSQTVRQCPPTTPICSWKLKKRTNGEETARKRSMMQGAIPVHVGRLDRNKGDSTWLAGSIEHLEKIARVVVLLGADEGIDGPNATLLKMLVQTMDNARRVAVFFMGTPQQPVATLLHLRDLLKSRTSAVHELVDTNLTRVYAALQMCGAEACDIANPTEASNLAAAIVNTNEVKSNVVLISRALNIDLVKQNDRLAGLRQQVNETTSELDQMQHDHDFIQAKLDSLTLPQTAISMPSDYLQEQSGRGGGLITLSIFVKTVLAFTTMGALFAAWA
ncbi:hypothetical protein HK102_003436, partial [Quaeritorhiza haematococci]